MATKTISATVHVCDRCNQDVDYPTTCKSCAAVVCYECRKKSGTEYSHGVHFCGSGDGYYCGPCDQKLLVSGRDETHNAYVAIRDLKNEARRWSADFEARTKAAEAQLRAVSK